MFVIMLMAMSSMDKEEEEFLVGLYRNYFGVTKSRKGLGSRTGYGE